MKQNNKFYNFSAKTITLITNALIAAISTPAAARSFTSIAFLIVKKRRGILLFYNSNWVLIRDNPT